MSGWDRVRALLRREKRELDDVADDFKDRANAALDRKEREMSATAEERFTIEQERAAEVDAELEAVRRRIEGESGGSFTIER